MPTYIIIHEKLCTLLYYAHTTTYNDRVLLMHFCRLLRFHTQRRFRPSLSVRVSDSGHPVTYARQFFTNTPGHKIYCCISACSTRHHTLLHNPTIIHVRTFVAPASHPRKIYLCMSAQSTQHHILLHNPTILHTKTFFAPACHPRKIYCYMTARSTIHHMLLHNTVILHTMTFFALACYPRHKILSTSKYDSKTNPSRKISLFLL